MYRLRAKDSRFTGHSGIVKQTAESSVCKGNVLFKKLIWERQTVEVTFSFFFVFSSFSFVFGFNDYSLKIVFQAEYKVLVIYFPLELLH